MLVSTIQSRAKRRYTRETLLTAVWDDLVERAVVEYSRWNPYLTTVTLTSVADQQGYEVDAACIGIQQVYLGTMLTANTINTTDPFDPPLVKKSMPSLALIDDINDAEYRRQTGFVWTWASKRLWIDPAPTSSGDDIVVAYYALHQATDSDYTTIPDEDLDIVVDLMLYEHIGDTADSMSLEPVSYQAGLERENFAGLQENTRMAREHLLQRVQGKYGGTGGYLWP